MKRNIEQISYYFLTIGFSLDHLTTKTGITNYGMFEANHIVSSLMELGLWFYIDSLFCISIIYITHLFLKKYMQFKLIICFPFISGLFRLFAGFINLLILI